MIDAGTIFNEIITVAMKDQGFDLRTTETVADPVSENYSGGYRKLTFEKDGRETFVTASLREIEMNNREEMMINLCKSRITDALAAKTQKAK